MTQRIVLDVEGTVCPIAFVHDTLFPYAVRRAEAEIPNIDFPLDAARSELEAYLVKFPAEYTSDAARLLDHIRDLVRRDVKAGYLKALQGYLWKSGYERGEIKAPVYSDAVAAIKRWAAHTKVYIYSSGSVLAQQTLFKHTNDGDLTPYLSGYFDTVNAGPKMEEESYKKIAASIDPPSGIRFFSDNPKEIDAAAEAGWETTFVIRPGNPEFKDYKWPDKMATHFDGI